MNAYAIKSNLHSAKLHFFHYLMFHGQSVEDEPFGRESHPCIGDDLSKNLYLTRNGRHIPPVFEASVSLVVSEAVKDSLQGIPHVTFLPVHFQKLVDFRIYPAGNFSFKYTADYQSVMKDVQVGDFLNQLPDVPALHKSVGRYYELIVCRLSDLVPNYSNTRSIACEIPMASLREVELTLSADILSDYPIVWWSYHVFSEAAFDRISSFIDRDYFSIVKLEVE